MANVNVDNLCILNGRLARDPMVFDNKDGSKKVKLTVAVERAYKNADGTRATDFIQVEQFIGKDRVARSGLGVFAIMDRGMKVGIVYHRESDAFRKADGTTDYREVGVIDEIKIEESKAESQARRSRSTAPDGPVQMTLFDETELEAVKAAADDKPFE